MEDDYHANYSEAPNDGSPWVDDPRDLFQVLRGGYYNNAADNVRTAYRYYNDTESQYVGYGFRLASGFEDSRPSVCGDGLREGGESCDDGNVSNGDGCPANCL